MSTPYESDLDDLHEAPSREREISLGAGTVLGIFLALAAVCGVFFAFGYTVGRRSNPKPLAVETAVSASGSGLGSGTGLGAGSGSPAPKPSPGSLLSGSGSGMGTPLPSSAGGGRSVTEESGSGAQVPAPAEGDGAAPEVVVKKPVVAPKAAVTAADGAVVGDPIPAAPKAVGATAGAAVGAAVGMPVMVQVAAVSHREDADLLLTALRQKGYEAVVRGGGQDSLMHIQVGPFASKKEAEAMRQRLLGDGFNAILK